MYAPKHSTLRCDLTPGAHLLSPAGLLKAVAAAAVAALLAVFVVLPSSAAREASAAAAPLSGAYVGGGDAAAATAFANWRGKPLQVVTEYVPRESWSALASPTWAADQWRGKGYLVAWGVPMLPESGGSMATGAAGGYNGYFRQLAQTLVSRGLGSSVIRLGWEMNGRWYRWSAVNDPGAYVSYWRQVVTAMRSISGAAFRFEWAPANGQTTSGFDVASAYPGDAYVDLIGTSFYDQSWAFPSNEVVKRWDTAVNERYGLAWTASFAQAHGKRLSLSEWGLSRRCDGHGGNDNPYYVRKIHEWTVSHAFFYESYFNEDMGSCEQHMVTGGTFPNAGSTYRQLFGPSSTSTTSTSTPAPTGSGSLDPSVLRVSWYSDRHDAKPLHGMRVSHKVYLFVQPGVTPSQVRFYLDDPSMSRAPRHTESSAPWDLVGGSSAAAMPFDTSTLSYGSHTLTVAVVTSTGTRVARASFTR